MASIAALVGTVIGTIIVTVWHKAIAEVASRPVPILQKDKIDSIVETIIKKEDEAPKVQEHEDVGDYIDSLWDDGAAPRLAFEKMESVTVTKDTARKITNTCKKLLEYYAMDSGRKKQFEKFRDEIKNFNQDMAKEIDISLFSQCAFWEGKIALYR